MDIKGLFTLEPSPPPTKLTYKRMGLQEKVVGIVEVGACHIVSS